MLDYHQCFHSTIIITLLPFASGKYFKISNNQGLKLVNELNTANNELENWIGIVTEHELLIMFLTLYINCC